jgi:hypothetical protein
MTREIQKFENSHNNEGVSLRANPSPYILQGGGGGGGEGHKYIKLQKMQFQLKINE